MKSNWDKEDLRRCLEGVVWYDHKAKACEVMNEWKWGRTDWGMSEFKRVSPSNDWGERDEREL